MGDFAIIHARTAYTRPDGSAGGGRYTDCWVKRDGRWVEVTGALKATAGQRRRATN